MSVAAQIILAILNLAGTLADAARERRLLKAGEDGVIAESMRRAMISSARRRRARRLALTLSPLLLTAACRTTAGGGIEGASFCAVARPIAWSRNDTRETLAGIAEHNAVGKAICGWAPPAR